MSELAALIIENKGDSRVVKFCGVELAAFNIVSDDYAYTHAEDWKHLFARSYLSEGADRLTMDKRVEEAKNYAWSNLDDTDLHKVDHD